MPTAREVITEAVTLAREHFVSADGDAGRLAEAWLAHILETCEAVLLLNANNFGDVAAPMRRAVIEHAVWLGWVSRHGDEAIPVLKAKYRANVARNEDVLRAWAAWSPEQVDKALAIERRPVPTMKAVIGELADSATAGAIFPQVWFGAYWSDSEQSHPSLGTARSMAEVPVEQWDAMLAAGLILALHSYSSMVPGDPWDPWIRDVIAKLAIAIGHSPSDLSGPEQT
ncbi:hypothetical protein KIN34_06375 [Cellulomonas sp. DKR-3]|uniref:TetR family transcriptional regulator n=1 Tax=Cellulomonas fulva TaxID=2835530 RepID=A0ABS5TXM7_9CELL|nr:hypothetical protein [Cellulomonas fulva]MBT0993911.1 hypothetical protein [Cellulomonas fulva]